MKLRVLCAQLYEGSLYMSTTPCTRCRVGWNKAQERCDVDTGSEHLPDSPSIPDCPIQDRCQHQIQTQGPCVVRRKGLICESALVFNGMPREEAMDHPLAFNAVLVAAPEDLAELEAEGFILEEPKS